MNDFGKRLLKIPVLGTTDPLVIVCANCGGDGTIYPKLKPSTIDKSGGKFLRLSKIARELDIGINTILEFLNQKGLGVKKGPIAKVSETTYAILKTHFSKELSDHTPPKAENYQVKRIENKIKYESRHCWFCEGKGNYPLLTLTNKACKQCSGQGKIPAKEQIDCTFCSGTGRLSGDSFLEPWDYGPDGMENLDKCDNCEGTGGWSKSIEIECISCIGTGKSIEIVGAKNCEYCQEKGIIIPTQNTSCTACDGSGKYLIRPRCCNCTNSVANWGKNCGKCKTAPEVVEAVRLFETGISKILDKDDHESALDEFVNLAENYLDHIPINRGSTDFISYGLSIHPDIVTESEKHLEGIIPPRKGSAKDIRLKEDIKTLKEKLAKSTRKGEQERRKRYQNWKVSDYKNSIQTYLKSSKYNDAYFELSEAIDRFKNDNHTFLFNRGIVTLLKSMWSFQIESKQDSSKHYAHKNLKYNIQISLNDLSKSNKNNHVSNIENWLFDSA